MWTSLPISEDFLYRQQAMGHGVRADQPKVNKATGTMIVGVGASIQLYEPMQLKWFGVM